MNRNVSVRNSLKLLVKSSIIILIGAIFSKLAGYAYRAVIARYYGPEAYGLFSLAVMIAGWITAIFAFGLSDGLLRFLAFHRGKERYDLIKYLFQKTERILIISGIFGGIALFFLSDLIASEIFHNSQLGIFLRITSIFIPLSIILGPLLSLLLAYEKTGWHSFIVNILQNVFMILSLVALIMLGFNSGSIMVSYVIGTFIALLTAFFVARKKIPSIFDKKEIKQDNSKEFKNLIDYSWPRLFLGIVASIFFWIDSFILGYFNSAVEVGYYNVAVPLAILLGFVPELFMRLFIPLVSKEYARGQIKTIRTISRQIGKWIFMVNIPVLFILILFPGAIINILFGEEYLPAANALRVLAIGSFSYSISLVSMNLLTMKGKSKSILYTFIYASIINIILNLMLVPKYGLMGASVATTLSYLILGGIFFYQTSKQLKIIPVKKEMIKIGIYGIIVFLLLYLIIKNGNYSFVSMIVMASVSCFIYALLIILTGLDKNDLIIIDSFKKKIRIFSFQEAVPLNKDNR